MNLQTFYKFAVLGKGLCHSQIFQPYFYYDRLYMFHVYPTQCIFPDFPYFIASYSHLVEVCMNIYPISVLDVDSLLVGWTIVLIPCLGLCNIALLIIHNYSFTYIKCALVSITYKAYSIPWKHNLEASCIWGMPV